MLYADAANAFIRDRKALGRSPATLRNNRLALANLRGSLPPGINVESITLDHLDAWIATMVDLGAGTKRGRIVGVAVFFKWCVRRGLRPDDPTLWLERPRLEQPVPRALEPEQVMACFAACLDEREELILSLLVMEGLRVCEVSRLELSDINLRDRMLLVNGKGNRQRVVPLTEETEAAMRRYWQASPPEGARPLVRQYDGMTTSARRRLGSESISRMVSELCWRAGVKSSRLDGVSAHAFRHTMLSDVFARTRNIRVVQELAGHSSITTTQIYLRHADLEEKRAAVAGRSYR